MISTLLWGGIAPTALAVLGVLAVRWRRRSNLREGHRLDRQGRHPSRRKVPGLPVDGTPLRGGELWTYAVLKASFGCEEAPEVIYDPVPGEGEL